MFLCVSVSMFLERIGVGIRGGTQEKTALPNVAGTIDSVEVRTWTEQAVEVDRISASALSPLPPTQLTGTTHVLVDNSSPALGSGFSSPGTQAF